MCKIIVKSFAGVVFAYILAIFKEYCANILYLKGIMIVILLKEAVMIRNRYSFLLNRPEEAIGYQPARFQISE